MTVCILLNSNFVRTARLKSIYGSDVIAYISLSLIILLRLFKVLYLLTIWGLQLNGTSGWWLFLSLLNYLRYQFCLVDYCGLCSNAWKCVEVSSTLFRLPDGQKSWKNIKKKSANLSQKKKNRVEKQEMSVEKQTYGSSSSSIIFQ